ncbi:Pimeloyl-ACP methyl ester carboxylesterase [Ruegeria halocynthiae]|uniref:Pimeloyl-ACP methyl ester carboxylesterase n=1 Tax=Ruegeria halocynthiae TaxID=985054 RepID=A0A1H3E9C5_9RHOB|nr:alpha/beta hydrolase [Ruegeria halocynthiae]SDX74489.1 Pimeloyl-ACP methyl ester carboxylesterase [Ruegeria halocynthiae]
MTLTTLQLSNSGQSVAFREAGKGQPVLLIHGVGMQSAAWGPQFDALSTHCRVIAVDLPGHGGSDRLPSSSQLSDFVVWLHDVVSALNLGSVAIIGHSMGALIAAGFAVEYPNETSRVALLNGVYCRDASSRAAVIKRAVDISAGRVDLETPLSRWFGDGPGDQTARAQVAVWLGSVDQEGYAVAYSAFAQGDAAYADKMSRISCPFLALTGDGDPNSTPAMSEAMVAAVQNGRAVVIQGHRHMVNLTAPDTVTEHLVEWLGQSAEERIAQ